MNEQIAHELTELRDPRRLAVSAHEVGHAIGAIAAGIHPEYVRLKFGMFGGFSGGYCQFDHHAPDATDEDKTARMIAIMAGHAAEVRFCQLYMGLGPDAAYKYGRSWAAGDYQDFTYWRFKNRIRISHDWAFDRATSLLERNTTTLDRLTLRLHRACRLSYAALPNGVSGGPAGH